MKDRGQSRPARGQRPRSWLAFSAAGWAFVFATFHVVWAAGWYVGLPAAETRRAFQNPWFYAYDVAVAVICVAGGFVALAFVRPWGTRVPRRLLNALALTGTGALVVRAGASAVQTVYFLAKERFVVGEWVPWEPWFYLGAVLFGLSTWRFRRGMAGRQAVTQAWRRK